MASEASKKALKGKIAPELYEHHCKLHDELAPETQKWHELIADKKDYICHEVIDNIKQFNQLVTDKVKEHNLIAQDLCEKENIIYKPLKNNYLVPVPEIGTLMKPQYCSCTDCEDSTEAKIETDTAPKIEEYCQCDSTAHKGLITSVLKAQPENSILKKFKTMTIEHDMIPDEYKGLFEKRS